MNKRAVVLVFSLLVTLVLGVLIASLYFKSISENQLAFRFINSTRALWLAEAGIARVKGSAGLSSQSGFIGDTNHTYSAIVSLVAGTTNYFNIASTGTVALPAGGNVSRTVTATAKTAAVDATKFKFGIETTTELEVRGSVDINPSDSWKEYSTLNFSDLFGIAKASMRDSANNLYTDASSFDMNNANNVTWVDVASGTQLGITGGNGSGVLIINGDVKITGNPVFSGIIYVIGELTMAGTPVINGSILAESSTTVDTSLGGNVTINYDTDAISGALNSVQFLSKEIVSWHE